MKFFLLFPLLFFPSAESQNCIYSQPEVGGYTCNLQIQNPSGNEIDLIGGNHLENRSDDDVQVLIATSQNTFNIPKILCYQFRNLVNFSIINSQVNLVSSSSFYYCENIERISLINNQISEIPGNSFSNSGNLRVLNLSGNRLNKLEENSLIGTRIEWLTLDLNPIEVFEGIWVDSINETLSSLDLMSTQLTEIQSNSFANLRNLKSLNLGVNLISNIANDAFLGLENLQILFLHGNFIQQLRPGWFNSMFSLEELRLEFNLINSLPARIFANNNRLGDLGLSYNRITSVNRNAFGDLTAMRRFYGEINFINAIDPDFFDAATNLTSMFLYDNICIRRNIINIPETRSEVRQSLQPCFDNFALTSFIHCDFISAPGFPYTCELQLENPGTRDDFERIEGDHFEGNSDVDVRRVEGYFQYSLNIPGIICTQFSGLEELILSSSKVEFITPEALENCVNLRILSLENNNITVVPDFVLRNSPRLEILDLNNNRINTLSDHPFDGTQIWYLNLEGNELWYLLPSWFNSLSESLLLLDVANNELTMLESDIFSELRNLIEIEIGFNNFGFIAPDAFSTLTNLQYLSMMSCGLTALNPSWFSNLTSLQTLHIQRNNIQELPVNIFNNLINLRDLYINNNNISLIDSESFGSSLINLRNFNAAFNQINFIDPNFFDNSEQLNALSLFGNLCHSNNYVNVQNSRDEIRQVLQGCFNNFIQETSFIRCQFFQNLPQIIDCEMRISNRFGIEFNEIEGEHTGGRNDSHVGRVLMFNQRTKTIPKVICERFFNLRILDVLNSSVEVLTPEAFENCRELEIIEMDGNFIQILPDFLFVNSPELRDLRFADNRIREIGVNALVGTVASMVNFNGNSLTTFNPLHFEVVNETLTDMNMESNPFTTLPSNAFSNLRSLRRINFKNNHLPSTQIPNDAFTSLENLEVFDFANCHLSDLNPAWFTEMPKLAWVFIDNNSLRFLPDNLFANNPLIARLHISHNQIQLLNSEIFADPSILFVILASFNRISSIDQGLFDNAVNLVNLEVYENFCANNSFNIDESTRPIVREELSGCFDEFEREGTINCRYSIDPMFEYACELNIQNLRGFDNFERVDGEHLNENSDENVQFLMGYRQNSGNVPAILCNQFVNLRQLYLTRSGVREVGVGSFGGCGRLENINLEFNNIRRIQSGVFPESLSVLMLNNNEIQEIDGNAFDGTGLAQISLLNNRLVAYDPSWFKAVGQTLIYINLGSNRIENLPENSFDSLSNLMEINMNNNPGISISPSAFNGLMNLAALRIENSGLRTLNPSWFSNLQTLARLYLARNFLTDITPETFELPSLNYLNLASNNLEVINSDWFGRNLQNLVTFNAQNNQINAIDQIFFENSSSLHTLQLGNNLCASINIVNLPNNRDQAREALQGCFDNFLNVPATISCDYQNDFPYSCSLTLSNRHGRNNFERVDGRHLSGKGDSDVMVIDSFYQNSPNIPRILCNQFENLIYIFMLNSGIRFLDSGSFAGCRNLVSISLDGNLILEIPDGVFSQNPGLMMFTAAGNRIERVGARSFEGTSLTLLDLEVNRIERLDVEVFQSQNSLLYLILRDNRIYEYPEGIFRDLGSLHYLDIGINPIIQLPSTIFENLYNLNYLGLSGTQLSSLNPTWFTNFPYLTEINLSNNPGIHELPFGVFTNLKSLEYLNLDFMTLSVLNSTSFGSSLDSIFYLRARANLINAIDEILIENSVKLNQLYLLGNLCTDMNFRDVQENLDEVRGELSRCFFNFNEN